MAASTIGSSPPKSPQRPRSAQGARRVPTHPAEDPTSQLHHFLRTLELYKDTAYELHQEEHPSVKVEHFKKFLEVDVAQEESCMSLPFSIAFLIIFVIVVGQHMQVELVYSLETALKQEVYKGMTWDDGRKRLENVSSSGDFFDWFQYGMRPALWRREFEGTLIPPYRWDRFLERHKIVGAIRIQQTRSQSKGCTVEDGMRSYFGSNCNPDTTDESTEEFGLGTYRGNATLGFAHQSGKGGFALWLDPLTAPVAVDSKIASLKEGGWLDEQTMMASIRVMTYNAEVAGGVFGDMSIDLEFGRGGMVVAFTRINSIHAQPYNHIEIVIVDMVFLFFLALVFLGEFRELREALAQSRFRSYLQFWNVVDWAAIVMGAAVVIVYAVVVGMAGSLVQQLEDIGAREGQIWDVDTLFSSEVLEEARVNGTLTSMGLDRFEGDDVQGLYQTAYADLESAVEVNQSLRMLLAVYCLILMLRFFKSFASQPRLALVTSTLSAASVDLVHFGMVFVTLLMTYSIAATYLFGQQLKAYHTWTDSVLTCFEILMGVFDFQALARLNTLFAFFWFWSFLILVFLVLLNMLLAIIMDTYSTVKSRSLEAVTLWGQGRTMIRRHRETKLGMRVSLQAVLRIMRSGWLPETITPEELVQRVEKLPLVQAERIIQRCVMWLRSGSEQSVSVERSVKLLYFSLLRLEGFMVHVNTWYEEFLMRHSREVGYSAPLSKLDTQGGSRKLDRVLQSRVDDELMLDLIAHD